MAGVEVAVAAAPSPVVAIAARAADRGCDRPSYGLIATDRVLRREVPL
jgi:hypothetical protein